jgi:hypothetical protein
MAWNYARAFWAGTIGGVVVTALEIVARARGIPVNVPMMLGTMAGSPPGPTSSLIGFAIHLILSGATGLVYAWAFQTIARRADGMVGLGFGLVHALMAGIAMGVISAVHPLMPAEIPAPGFFLVSVGGVRGVIDELVMYMVYGAIVGEVYGRGTVDTPARGHARVG